jgi:ATP-dependent Clp protease ATP-binding subunit ClpC
MTLIVMTSNLGAGEAPAVGFEGGPSDDFERSVRRHFRPELFNRIDHVVSFRKLSPADIARIVDLELEQAQKRTGLVRRNLRLDVRPEARARLAELGWHPMRGARPLKRAIEEHVVAKIAALLAREPRLRDAVLSIGHGFAISVTS